MSPARAGLSLLLILSGLSVGVCLATVQPARASTFTVLSPRKRPTPRRVTRPITVRRDGLLSTVGGIVTRPFTAGAGALAGAGLSAVSGWVLGGAKAALEETAKIISRATTPELESTWFSSTYWRVAGLSTLLTMPFLFAAAVQALIRSDLTLLARAAFGYLPLALIGVAIAAPLTMLVMAATDQMCSVVAGPGIGGGARFLDTTASAAAGFSILNGSAFFAFMIGLITVAAALCLTLELLVREAAVYIVVLMLPLAFAALVWPARRVWAFRLVELLFALILSKFVIVAVLSLAGAAYGATGGAGVSRLLTAMSLVMLSCFAPWALLSILPFAEVAASAGGSLRARVPSLPDPRSFNPSSDGGVAPAISPETKHDAEAAGSVLPRDPLGGGGGPTERPGGGGPTGGGPDPGPSGGGAAAAEPRPAAEPAPESQPLRKWRLPGMDREWQADDDTREFDLVSGMGFYAPEYQDEVRSWRFEPDPAAEPPDPPATPQDSPAPPAGPLTPETQPDAEGRL